jgi:hypothetical protein
MRTHLPAPTVWPAVLASGVTFAAMGLITSPLLIAFGVVVVIVSIGGWIGELLKEGE